jgi:radical SAM superfamily enzyme YgiQ (UPF0313 family)
MKLLLISLQSNAYVTGLKYIAANVKRSGNNVKILLLPGYLEKELNPAIEKFISDYTPDLIGIGLMSIEFYPAKNLTRLIKNKFDLPVIWGGVHAIIKPDECIKHTDYVCTGEGERPVVLLLEHLKANGKAAAPAIAGIWSNIKGSIGKNPASHPEDNLDGLPYQEYLPDYYYGLHKDRIYRFVENEHLFRLYALYGGTCHMMITTRGCPFKCSYCGNSAFMSVYGRSVRKRSVSSVIEEILEVINNPYVLYINFQDDCFFAHTKEWIRDFCKQYKSRVGLPFVARVIPTMMDREKMQMLSEAGLSWIVMGIQSGSDRVNFEIYDRKVTFSKVKEATDIISETRAAPFYEMIVDNPYETEADMMQTVNAISSLKKPFILSLAHLTFFPGTPLADKAVRDNIVAPDAYLYRYLLRIDETYINRLLGITPYMPKAAVRFLNRVECRRTRINEICLGFLYFFIKRGIEPAVLLYIAARSLDYKLKWILRTVTGNWRATLARFTSRYLGKGDLEFDQRLEMAKKNMPELFKE